MCACGLDESEMMARSRVAIVSGVVGPMSAYIIRSRIKITRVRASHLHIVIMSDETSTFK